MPPRPKRTRLHPARATTRSQAQAAKAPSKAAAGPSGPAPQRTRSKLIMEVVLPTSRKSTPKASAAPTPDSLPAVDLPPPQEPEETDQDILQPTSPTLIRSPPARASTPCAAPPQEKGKQKMNELPPSSPPPMSSPEQGLAWDRSSRASTPTPSPSRSRSRQTSRQGAPTELPTLTIGEASGIVLVPGTPSSELAAAQLLTPISSPPPTSVSPPKPPTPPTQRSPGPDSVHKPPTSPIPYSDTAAPDDPFGFLAAEDRLRERRAMLERDNPIMGFGMPSSGGPEDFDQSVYEEAFASIFYDPESGTIEATQTSTAGSDKENAGIGLGPSRGNGKGRVKKTMEVVIPAKAKEKGKEDGERAKQNERGKDEGKGKEKEGGKKTAQEAQGSTRGKSAAKERVLTTYELEAMLPRRPKRTRKPRAEDPEEIDLSEDEEEDDEEDAGSKRRKKTTSSRGRAATRGKVASKGARGKGTKASPSKSTTNPATRTHKRTRSSEMAHMDDETRKRFEAERNRRLEQYKALDGYTLEEEEVVW